MSSETSHTLYLCYFGLREPLVQTQVLPYLREIKKLGGMKISLLTFEPNPKETLTAEQIKIERKKLADEEIEWSFLTYHKRLSALATLYDVLCGAYFTWKLMRREQVDILHARVHVPALMGAIARKFSRGRPKLIFDIRGFLPEEYTDAGRWKENGWLYRSVKHVEKWLFKESDAFVVLTEKAREVLFPESRETNFDKFSRPIEVIPCCVDFNQRFQDDKKTRTETRQELNLADRLVITHVGMLGGLYLTEEITNFLEAARLQNPKTFALFLTQTDPNLIIPLLQKKGFKETDYFVKKVSPADVPKYLSASDIALSFVQATYATISRSPTKIPEYLASGLPIISNRGVGDVDELIETDRVGVLLESFNREGYLDALEKIKNLRQTSDVENNCKLSAKKRFDLVMVGGSGYKNLYRKLLQTERSVKNRENTA